MTTTEGPIAHTTDLSGEDGAGFVHAVALAVASGSPLVTVHGNAGPELEAQLPDAAPLAARWGRTVAHRRHCHTCCDDVTDTLLDAVHQLQPRLVISGSHGRHGLRALLHGNVSEELARNLTVPMLVVPNHGRGFVDERDGSLDLRRIVVPAGDEATARHGTEAARAFAAAAGVTGFELIVVPLEGITAAAQAADACMIVMTTRGHDGLHDALFGSHTDHAIRDARCPVLITAA